ncbi:MAG: hypothetical protein JO218_19055 [Burkholderiales bacterium]|nr:hypothetical protein [Burkholderiales bacterium]
MGKDNSIYAASASLSKLPRARMVWKVLGGVVLLIVIYVTYAIFVDESLDPGIAKYYQKTEVQVPDVQNAVIYLRALDAPAGADLLAFGRADIVNEQRYLDDMLRWRRATGYPYEIKQAIEIKGDVNAALYCNETSLSDLAAREKCISTAGLRSLIERNQEILGRYEHVLALPYYQGTVSRNTMLSLSLAKLYCLNIDLSVREGKVEEAYQLWVAFQRYILRAHGSDSLVVDKSVMLVSEGIGYEALNEIMVANPDVLINHHDEIEQMLKTQGLNSWNFRADFVWYYRNMNRSLEVGASSPIFHPNFIRNRIYRTMVAIESVLDSEDPKDYSRKTLDIWHQYGDIARWSNDYLRDPLNTFPSRYVYCNGLKAYGQIAQNVVRHDDIAGLIKLVIKARQQNITDDQMPAFIQREGNAYPDRIDGLPIVWDAKHRTIGYGDPATYSGLHFRVP